GDHATRDGNCDCKGTLRARGRVARCDQAAEDAEVGVKSAGWRPYSAMAAIYLRYEDRILFAGSGCFCRPSGPRGPYDCLFNNSATGEPRSKGDKARIDASPQITAIFDGTSGELINLLNDQKTIVRISPDKMRAIADMLNKFNSNKAASDKPRLTATGQR